jgi:putative FmdB family regulatory protein
MSLAREFAPARDLTGASWLPIGSQLSMPTYEYLCSSCGNTWEEVQRISEPALEVCPKCSKRTAKRQISAGNFILKGGGWYADAYSSAKPAKKEEGGSSDTKASDMKSSDAKASKDGGASAGDTKSDAKSESKTEGTSPAKKADSVAPKAPKASGTSGEG